MFCIVFHVIVFYEIKSANQKCSNITSNNYYSMRMRPIKSTSFSKALSVTLYFKPWLPKPNSKHFSSHFVLCLLVLANYIETNTGPKSPRYPCGVCHGAVTLKHKVPLWCLPWSCYIKTQSTLVVFAMELLH